MMNQDEAKLLLLGMDALPIRERWLLAWLVDVGSDIGMRFLEFTEDAGIDFGVMCARWRRMGLLRSGYDWERDHSVYEATERAVQLVHLSAVEWVCAHSSAELVDLDAVAVAA
ncbi:hypothetical protein [Nocardia sp. CA-119907]|uniref:hypothetical protein n=1 Tax=Nocardia sp. CA-119907 TaxID=3239973 RepID=UPI003D952D67